MKPESKMNPQSIRAQSIGRMLNVLTKKMKAEMKARLAPMGLTMNEFFVFMSVLNHAGMSQTELSKSMGEPAYTTSRIIDAMVIKNLVRRKPDARSRRTHNIFLTEQAMMMAPNILNLIQVINDWILAPLDPDEKQSFADNLAKLL